MFLCLISPASDIFVSLSSVEYVANEGDRFAVLRIDKTGVTPNNEDTELLLTLTDGTAQGAHHTHTHAYTHPAKE